MFFPPKNPGGSILDWRWGFFVCPPGAPSLKKFLKYFINVFKKIQKLSKSLLNCFEKVYQIFSKVFQMISNHFKSYSNSYSLILSLLFFKILLHFSLFHFCLYFSIKNPGFHSRWKRRLLSPPPRAGGPIIQKVLKIFLIFFQNIFKNVLTKFSKAFKKFLKCFEKSF